MAKGSDKTGAVVGFGTQQPGATTPVKQAKEIAKAPSKGDGNKK